MRRTTTLARRLALRFALVALPTVLAGGARAATAAPGCPYSAPIATSGNKVVLDVKQLFTAKGVQVDRNAVQQAVECAKTALGSAWPGQSNTVIARLPRGLVDLSTAVREPPPSNALLNGSIDLSGISCPNVQAANCGVSPTATISPTSNQFVLRGADDGSTVVRLTQDQTLHSEEIVGLWLRNSVNVLVQRLAFTYLLPTVSQGRISAVADTYADITVEAGYPDPAQLADKQNFATQGRFLHVMDLGTDEVTGQQACHFRPDAIDAQGAVVPTQAPYLPDGIQQVLPGVWRVWFESSYSATKPVPLKQDDYVAIKSKAGKNAYDIRNAAFFTFDAVTWRRKSRGVFGGALNDGSHAPTQVTVKNSVILQEDMGSAAPACLSTPDGGPQFGGTTGFPSQGHTVTDNVFVSPGDDAVAFFDVSNTVLSGNRLWDSFSNRGALFRFSAAATTPVAPTEGGSGFNVCQPGNTLTRDIYYWVTGDIPNTASRQITCP